jgi:hypothetical protein
MCLHCTHAPQPPKECAATVTIFKHEQITFPSNSHFGSGSPNGLPNFQKAIVIFRNYKVYLKTPKAYYRF